jgi:peptidoglycan hydrolase-like protein with peptidoglycan-binding domain
MALEAQQALAQLDYYHGPVDGLVGPAYEEAVRKYQVMNGLPVTGVVTRPVLDHMQMAATVIFAQSTDVIVHKVQTPLPSLVIHLVRSMAGWGNRPVKPFASSKRTVVGKSQVRFPSSCWQSCRLAAIWQRPVRTDHRQDVRQDRYLGFSISQKM